MAGLNEDK